MTNKTTRTKESSRPLSTVLLYREDAKYGVKVGVTFETSKGNQRMVWDVIPSSIELHKGTLILVPYEEKPL